MGQRLDLQILLEQLLGSGNVYFQPPANINVVYPAIVYERDRIDTMYADNKPVRLTKRYSVTVIERDPDSLLPMQMASLKLCAFNRHFTTSGLHHTVFTLYF